MGGVTKQTWSGVAGLAVWLLTATLFALRALGVIAWQWVWVFAPLLISGGIMIVIALVAGHAIYKGFTE